MANSTAPGSRIVLSAAGEHQYGDYLELQNTGAESILLSGWKLQEYGENYSSEYFTIPQTVLDPGEFLVLCQNNRDFSVIYTNALSAHPEIKYREVFTDSWGYSSSGNQTVIIRDQTGAMVDLVFFKPSVYKKIIRQGTKNNTSVVISDDIFVSIERNSLQISSLDMENWTSSACDLGTVFFRQTEDNIVNNYTLQIFASPGLRQSASLHAAKKLQIDIRRGDFIWSPGRQNFTIEITVNKACALELKVFSKDGRYIGTYLKNIRAGDNAPAKIFFNGGSLAGRLKPDLYFLTVTAVNNLSGETAHDKIFFAAGK